ncbi:MAG: hypothetical protein JSS82_15660 [Bacteroidetes bacterium]|nr:hypothetical protein [Bacteroidota bacterium]
MKVYLFETPRKISANCAVASGSISFKAYTDEEKKTANEKGYANQKVSIKVVGPDAEAFTLIYKEKQLIELPEIAEMKVNLFQKKDGTTGSEIVITCFTVDAPTKAEGTTGGSNTPAAHNDKEWSQKTAAFFGGKAS